MNQFEEIKKSFKKSCLHKAIIYQDRDMLRFGLDSFLDYYRQYLAGVFMFTDELTPEEYKDEVAKAGAFVKKILYCWESAPEELDAMLESLAELISES